VKQEYRRRKWLLSESPGGNKKMTGNWIRWASKEKGVWKMERYRINNEGKNQA
jgi:hypothetical protein